MIIEPPSTTVSTEQFLNDLCGLNAQIYFNVDGITWKNRPSTYDDIKDTLNWLNTVKYKDMYFIPNCGGTKDAEITHFKAAFIDWDAGKDPQGNYFPLDIVAQKKAEFLLNFQSSPVQPSYIIETRNGFHIYWLLYPGTTPEQFIALQKSLIHYFHSDPMITNPARVMRLPGYHWYKSQDPCNAFYVDIIHASPLRYSFLDLYQSFHSEPESQAPCSEGTASIYPDPGDISAPNNTYVNRYNTRSIIGGTSYRDPIVLTTLDEAVEYVCRQDLAQYLGYSQTDDPMTIPCPFHKDDTPSASIYQQDGKYYLKCHSSNCSFRSGTIIQVVAKKEKIPKSKALLKLMEHYQIQLDSSWKDKTKGILERNIQRILHAEDWKEQYPDLYRCVARIKMDLISKLDYAQDHLGLQSSNGTALFFCSLREFERLSSGLPYLDEKGRQNQRVDRYCLLGLLHKVHPDQIPWGLWRGLQEVSGKRRYRYWTQVYSVPEYTDELFQQANTIAKQLRDAGVRMNAISKDLILEVFGKEKALEIYPQSEEDTISEHGKQFRQEVGAVLNRLLDAKGYTTVSDLVEQVHRNRTWISVTDRRVKKHLPGLLQQSGLVEIKLTKVLKECLKIDGSGYPKVIIRKTCQVHLNRVPDTHTV